MIIREKAGRITDYAGLDIEPDWLDLEWFETRKRILHKKTCRGLAVSMKFLAEAPEITEGDVLYADADRLVVARILPCDCIVVKPDSLFETASLCYEIGNKHLPLFFEDNALLVPFEMPLYRLLTAQGYAVLREERKLLQPLKTTVSPHASGSSGSLFSKIMQLTNS
ncbi:urease accessory protein [Dyadobacter sp. BE34]|uniref:Urease accessory protein UreE n=1 Tax=Dyadobacter fermentans TaxID=94254 RepID=A0ABU1R0J4_9BACT|nr:MULTISPECIES: urease accessory protein UreE [Dyadobacter]MDR6806938.1 urease accessory protein [Dyadobacter fermentans]MDR7044680.1 urease accessory protein [Dyadobacter sp. BE242]MDR7198990.1 urease accessory protein [Dyadobacter sp. BE34]MDR7216952.1 urease accessory protein [Dyadobacter sp. BE31]MDR7263522.1 urease accessory protein [Dyadobacter sp. BE32]